MTLFDMHAEAVYRASVATTDAERVHWELTALELALELALEVR